MSEALKSKAINGIIWSALERFSIQGVQFIIMIIMARLLTPRDYGLLGMLAVFMAIAQSLIDSGFSQALIRKQKRTETDYSTIFFFNIVVSVIIYLILYVSAPLISIFYKEPELSPIIQIIGLTIIINSFAIVPKTILTINIDFRTQAKVSLIATIIAGFCGIYFAYSGIGVWSLVYHSIILSIINTILIWSISKWRPLFAYSWKSLKELFSFGSKLLISGLIDTIYKNIYPIIIGKSFSAGDLGYYSRAQHFSEFPSSNITGILQRVTYPILCNIQNDDNRLRNIYRRFLKVSAFIIFPLMTGLAAVSHPLIIIIIGEKWQYCAILLQIICFNMMWYPIHAINLNLLQVKGRSDLFLKLEIIKKILGISIICTTLPLGIEAMCYGSVVGSIICLAINTYYTGKLINIGFIKQLSDLLPTLSLSISMFIIVISIIKITSTPSIQLALGVSIGIIFYVGISYFYKYSELDEILNILKRK